MIKINYKNKEGSALMIVMLIFFTIFIISFASGYLVFLNVFKSSDASNSVKAYRAASAGIERAQFEAIENDYAFADSSCPVDIFSEDLSNGASYIINCIDNSGDLEFYSVGRYEQSQVALRIDCININEDCLSSCREGSLCGGGKLLAGDAVSSCPACIPHEGDVYPAIEIGSQCWLAKNINFGTRLNLGTAQSDNSVVEKYCYDNLESNCDIYGGLYQFSEAKQHLVTEPVQGVCPVGWHVPSNAEWTALTNYLSANSQYWCGGVSTKVAKSLASTSGWGSNGTACNVGNDQPSNNVSGFTALPGGRCTSMSFQDLGGYANFWSSTVSSGLGYRRFFSNVSSGVDGGLETATYGMSIRCLKD